MVSAIPSLVQDLEEAIRGQTGHRVQDLAVEIRAGRVVLRGQASSYHVKQLAQHGIAELLPRGVKLENAITVTRTRA